jgi:uncharacterized Zn-binding protein involved in type VI secretion
MNDKQTACTYFFATAGSRTERGGWIDTVTTEMECQGRLLARVGDIVRYDDGSEATIIDGAGLGAIWEGQPLALVGSRLSNGDRVAETPQNYFGIEVRPDKPVLGLFDPAYVYSPPDGDNEGRA